MKRADSPTRSKRQLGQVLLELALMIAAVAGSIILLTTAITAISKNDRDIQEMIRVLPAG